LSENGQRGSLLVCNWPHSVGKNHFYVMILANRDSAIQKCFQKIQHSLQVRKFDSLSAVRTTCHTVRTPICPKCQPSGRRELSVRTFPYVEKFQTAPACIHSDVSAARPNESQCSTSFRISFQNIVMGRSLQPSGRLGFPSGRAYP
jgi:hypothetical protein